MTTNRIDDRYATGERFTTNKAIQAAARKLLSDTVWNYLNCGTGDEVTLRANIADFDRLQFRTPLFAGISNPDTSTSFLGHHLSFPALIAPFGGGEQLLHGDGHCATGRAAAAAGIRQIVPVAAAHSLETIAAATGVAQMFQLTFVGKVESVLAMIERAKAAGYEQIVATYSPIRQWRERMMEDRFSIRTSDEDGNFGAGKSDPDMLREQLAFTQPRWGWQQAEEVIHNSPLPVFVKGVMEADEATRAMQAGAAGLYVSNYGGRSIDRMPSSISALPKVRAAVGKDVPIIFDSGIRRGSDIAAAMALGANVVALGRSVGYGLAADGEAGARRVLELLKAEFWTTLGHLGCSRVDELGPHNLDARMLAAHIRDAL
jgi:4-hydroxymandelate oxidase